MPVPMKDKKNILIIDDEPAWLGALSSLLRSRGYQVKKAESGAEALATLKRFRPDLIFVDVKMPDMNGFDLLDHIKKLPKIAATPVVFVSAIDDFHARKVARELGAADYLLKPVDTKEIVSALEKYIPD
jgi:CheY-like chemotaxis protein